MLEAGDVVLLAGDLGAGKTALTKGIAAGMRIPDLITSPTFVIARSHRATPPHPGLIHVDAYRLDGRLELDDLDLDTDLARSAVVVEWGVGVAEQLADDHLLIELQRHPDDTRTAVLHPRGRALGRPGRLPAGAAPGLSAAQRPGVESRRTTVPVTCRSCGSSRLSNARCSAVRPISASGSRTVVSPGTTSRSAAMSPKPATATSPGTRSPESRSAATAPIAIESSTAKTQSTSTPWSSRSRSAA